MLFIRRKVLSSYTDADKPYIGMLSFKGEQPKQVDALVVKAIVQKRSYLH